MLWRSRKYYSSSLVSSNQLELWLKVPSLAALPDIASLSVSDISHVLSLSATNRLGPLPETFWAQTADRMIEVLTSSTRAQTDVVSAIHIIDRIASHHVLPARLDEVIAALNPAGIRRVSRTDAFIATRAGLLLGYPQMSSVLSKNHCAAFSNQNLVALVTLCRESSVCGSLLMDELTSRIEKDVNSFSTYDLISLTESTATLSLADSARVLSRALKLVSTELVRRIELRCVSPHSAVTIIQTFSGLPPFPINPTVLQASYALLLENYNYKKLSRDEIARVLHAMSLSEIENLVLTRCLIREFVRRRPSCSNSSGALPEDPRVALRGISAVSLLKSFVPPAFVHALSCGVANRVVSSEDLTALTTALVNLVGSRGVCPQTIEDVLQKLSNDVKSLDFPDSATALLLAICGSMRSGSACACGIELSENMEPIPDEALEITAKSNPAMPNSDMQKKRLAKRIKKRGESLFDSLDAEWPTESKNRCSSCSSGVTSAELVAKLAKQCLQGIQVDTHQDTRDACIDVLSALILAKRDVLDGMTKADLEAVNELMDRCLSVRCDKPEIPREDYDRSAEGSVGATARNLGFITSSPFHTNSLVRISTLIHPS